MGACRSEALFMPRYEYQSSNPSGACEHCRGRFEVLQTMHDLPLRTCPECGGPIERVISLCAVSGTMSARAMLSDKNLKEKGFTKLVNEGGGRFRKTV